MAELLRAGANSSAKSDLGMSAVDCATTTQGRSSTHKGVLRLLRQHAERHEAAAAAKRERHSVPTAAAEKDGSSMLSLSQKILQRAYSYIS